MTTESENCSGQKAKICFWKAMMGRSTPENESFPERDDLSNNIRNCKECFDCRGYNADCGRYRAYNGEGERR